MSPDALAAIKVVSSNPLSGDEHAIQEGKTLYRAVCVVCHGMRANGRGRGIAGASNLQKFKRGYTLYVEIVKKGKKKMPPYGGGRVLSEEEIDQIGAYLETLAVRGAVWLDPQ